LRRFALWAGSVAVVSAIVIGVVFAGSADRLADGTQVAGIDVGGMTPAAARSRLQRRGDALQNVPVSFTAGGKTYKIRPHELGVYVDWVATIKDVEQSGGGFGVIRGYRRLGLELFPQSVAPKVVTYDAAVNYEVRVLAQKIDHPHVEASLVRHGLHISIAAGRTGTVLDQAAAKRVIVAALASFARSPVALPVRSDPPTLTVASLIPAQRAAAQVVAAPVTLHFGATRWRVPRWRLATLLQLATPLRIAGSAAESYFAQLRKSVDQPARNATWRPVSGGGVKLVSARDGTQLDVVRTAAALLAAAKRTTNRVATVAVQSASPSRSTSAAQAMGITGTVGSYETIYGGDPNRIHNVQLVARLIDGKLIAPGATFSFNGATGERSAAKGFLTAPVIINGEVETGLGGGVCQVSTTVFNAAYEAGLRITARTNHALYISHYPLGRDATVDYPDIDLKFVNDTTHWLLLRTFVNPSSLSVVLYGTPQHRRVVSIAQPLTVLAQPPVQKTVDATLKPGEVVVDDSGVPAQSTSVERKVYSASGTLLSDETWYSSYRAQPKIVRVGPKQPKKKPPATTTTPPTQSPPATTTAPE
jgi:vancomycin resistance protein YoaR